MRDPNCTCSARGWPRPRCLITRVTWCTCELHEAKTRETLAEKTSETGEAKDLIIVTKATEMEETPKSGTPLAICHLAPCQMTWRRYRRVHQHTLCQTKSWSPCPDIRRPPSMATALFMGTLPQRSQYPPSSHSGKTFSHSSHNPIVT